MCSISAMVCACILKRQKIVIVSFKISFSATKLDFPLINFVNNQKYIDAVFEIMRCIQICILQIFYCQQKHNDLSPILRVEMPSRLLKRAFGDNYTIDDKELVQGIRVSHNSTFGVLKVVFAVKYMFFVIKDVCPYIIYLIFSRSVAYRGHFRKMMIMAMLKINEQFLMFYKKNSILTKSYDSSNINNNFLLNSRKMSFLQNETRKNLYKNVCSVFLNESGKMCRENGKSKTSGNLPKPLNHILNFLVSAVMIWVVVVVGMYPVCHSIIYSNLKQQWRFTGYIQYIIPNDVLLMNHGFQNFQFTPE
ncbi:hypothetical protein BDA99DRAFT_542418 [Phascolomyces articulosus]|uniref:Uncharacterized protein n=1 Tax=Phascolomyces articulosus TaxID=60185 RepID=A0AAD5K037_9FUNG|nr:hypothetical protein BDA99DRAFT_542418 [Phascolomyces articulosus]